MSRKSILKRIKFTKTGKLLHRKAGHNHFNAKVSRRVQMRRKQTVQFPKAFRENIKTYLKPWSE